MQQAYWSKVLNQRVRRRRALASTGGTAVGAALLAACGGNTGGENNVSGLLTLPADTTKQAKRGGIIKDRTFGDPPTLDIFTSNNPLNPVCTHSYSTLVQFKPGYLKPAENELIGDLVESWEWSPDGLQITMKLRPGVKWHNKPPVNGRALDVDDVLFTWDRFTRKSSARGSVANVVNPEAPVLSLTATDSKTVVLKLKEPIVYAFGLFAYNRSGSVSILPKETDTIFDSRNDMIGTGPFTMTNYTASVGFTFKRNPEYYDKDWPLVDEVDLPIIPEYAAMLAQLKAGNIYSSGNRNTIPGVRQEDILSVKREEPQLLIYQGDLGAGSTTFFIMKFGYLSGSPFHDERVRQAISMSWDRDLYLDTFHNVSSFEAEGLPIETRWDSHLGATNEGWWLDPKGKDFGPNAKYFKHDLAEARKLLNASGYPNGMRDVVSNYVTGPELGTLPKQAEVMDGMIAELGITTRVRSTDYLKEYIPLYRDGRGQFEGWAFTGGGGRQTGGDAAGSLSVEWWSKAGASFHGFDRNGRGDQSGDPQVDALIEKARVERDTEKRRALVFDIQRYLAKPMYAIENPGPVKGFIMAWPCLGNFRVYETTDRLINHYLWIDKTRPPFKSG